MTTTGPGAPPDGIDEIHDRVQRELRRQDQRYTSGRRRLVSLLAEAGRPVTLPELLALDEDLSQSSAYRNLDVLERTGLVRRITVGPDHAHYELAEPLLGHHHHLVCVTCGDIRDVRLDESFEATLESTLSSVAADIGFTPLHHRLDLYGHCDRCED